MFALKTSAAIISASIMPERTANITFSVMNEKDEEITSVVTVTQAAGSVDERIEYAQYPEDSEQVED